MSSREKILVINFIFDFISNIRGEGRKLELGER